jgi:hypothetical protein
MEAILRSPEQLGVDEHGKPVDINDGVPDPALQTSLTSDPSSRFQNGNQDLEKKQMLVGQFHQCAVDTSSKGEYLSIRWDSSF